MENEFKLLPVMLKSIPVLVLLLACFFSPLSAVPSESPWVLNRSETLREGVLSSINNNCVTIISDTGMLRIPLASQPTAGLIGRRYGRLIRPEDFPPGLRVELFVTPQGTVRAIRNKPETFILPEGRLLPGWGHNASLSPDGEHYLINNLAFGLSLHTLSAHQPPLVLSPFYCPCTAWHHDGDQVAFAPGDDLIIYDLVTGEFSATPLRNAGDEFAFIVTGLAWNQDNDKLLYTFLEDCPDLGSDLFSLAVLDEHRQRYAVTTVPSLGTATWLKNDLVFYTTFNNIEQDTGEGFIWDYRTALTSSLLPEIKGGYHNVSYNRAKDLLAYTVPGQIGEEIYIVNTSLGMPQKILSYPLPVRNLQWSGHDSLYFWDEMNNRIYEIEDLFESAQPIARANGYLLLPPGATSQAGGQLLYFLSEPDEEPQQPYLLSYKQQVGSPD